ncbi:MAG: zinc ribbon domain-containing protein [Eubacteriales bacterium]
MNTAEKGREVMVKFCRNCGNKVGENARFCAGCGNALNRPDPKNIAFGADSGYTSRSSKAYRTSGEERNVTVPPSFSAKPHAVRAASGKKALFLKIIALAAAFALLLGGIVQIKKCADGPDRLFSDLSPGGIISPGSVNITYSDSDYKKAQSVSLKVTPESSSAVTNGITADFGDFNIREDCTLEIKTLKAKTDAALGLTARLYDFTVTGEKGLYTEFALPVDITLPCSDAADEIAFIQAYDRETGTWTMIPCSRDTEAGTISFQTSHFSGYAEFTSAGDVLRQIPGSMFSYVGEYRGQTTPVMLTDGNIDKLLSEYNPETVKYTLLNGKIPPEDIVTNAFGLFNNTSSGVDVATGAEVGLIDLKKVFNGATIAKINPALTAFGTALVLGKISYQLYKGVDMATVITDNAFDMVESGLAIIALATGAAPIAFAATAVFAAGFIYDMTKSDEPDEWDEYTYHHYNKNEVWFDTINLKVTNKPSEHYDFGYIKLDIGGDGCATAFGMIYKEYESDPKKLYSELEKLIDGYTEAFWLLDPPTIGKYYASVRNEQITINAPDYYPDPGEDRLKILKYNFENKLKGSLQPLLKEYVELSFLKFKEAFLRELHERYLPMLNEIITFEIIDPALPVGATFDRSEYADPAAYQIMLGVPVIRGFNASGLDYSTARDHVFKAVKNSNEVFKCSMWAYMAQGMPNTIEIDDLKSDGELLTFPFVVDTPVTVITLGQEFADSLTFKDGSMNEDDWEKFTCRALKELGVIKPDPKENGLFKITLSTSMTDEDNEKEDPNDYVLKSDINTIRDLVIEGVISEESTCKISMHYSLAGSTESYSTETFNDFGGVKYVHEYINTKNYSHACDISGTGTAKIIYDPEVDPSRYLVLYFTSITVKRISQESWLSIDRTDEGEERAGEEGEPVTTVEEDDWLTLRFKIN